MICLCVFFVSKAGKEMIKNKHQNSGEIRHTLDDLNAQWEELYERSADKGQKLRDAMQQKMLNRALEDAQVLRYFLLNLPRMGVQIQFRD